MRKVSEKVDLSRRVLDINIQSPIFSSMMHDFDVEIKRVIEKLYDEEFEGGEISVKLTLSTPTDYKEFPRMNDDGEMVNELYTYKRPRFEHKVSTTLKKQYNQKGVYTDEREIKLLDGEYIAVTIEDPQMCIDDLEKAQ